MQSQETEDANAATRISKNMQDLEQAVETALEKKSDDASQVIRSLVDQLSLLAARRSTDIKTHLRAVQKLASQHGPSFLVPYTEAWVSEVKAIGSVGCIKSASNYVAILATPLAGTLGSAFAGSTSATQLSQAIAESIYTMLASTSIGATLDRVFRYEGVRGKTDIAAGHRVQRLALTKLAEALATLLLKVPSLSHHLVALCKAKPLAGKGTTAIQNAAVIGCLGAALREISLRLNAMSAPHRPNWHNRVRQLSAPDQEAAAVCMAPVLDQLNVWFQQGITNAPDVDSIYYHAQVALHFGLGAIAMSYKPGHITDVVNSAARACRRAPLVGCEAVKALAQAVYGSVNPCNVLIGSLLADIPAALANESKSSDSTRRQAAIDALKMLGTALGRKLVLAAPAYTKDIQAACIAVLTQLQNVLVGKAGSAFPASDDAKLNASNAYSQFASSLVESVFSAAAQIDTKGAETAQVIASFQAVVEAVSTAFLEYLAKDTGATTRTRAFAALAQSLAPSSLPLDSPLLISEVPVSIPPVLIKAIITALQTAKPDDTPTYSAHGALVLAARLLFAYGGQEPLASSLAARTTSELREALNEKAVMDKLTSVASTALEAVVMRETALAATAIIFFVKGGKKEKKLGEADADEHKEETTDEKKSKKIDEPKKKKAAAGTIPSFLVPYLNSTVSLLFTPTLIANANKDETDLLIAMLAALLSRHAASIIKVYDSAAAAAKENGGHPAGTPGSGFEGDHLYAFAGAFIATAQLRLSCIHNVRIKARQSLDPAIASRPEIGRLVLQAATIIGANSEFALVSSRQLKPSNAEDAARLDYWPLRTAEGNLLTAIAQKEVPPVMTRPDDEDAEPIYAVGWDGSTQYFCIKRHNTKALTYRIKTYSPSDALAQHPNPSADSMVWASFLEGFGHGLDGRGAAYMLLLAASPASSQSSTQPIRFVEAAARRLLGTSNVKTHGEAKSALASLLVRKRGIVALNLLALIFSGTPASELVASAFQSTIGSATTLGFGTGWIASTSIDRRRAAIVALAAVAQYAPSVFAEYKVGMLIEKCMASPAALSLSPYQVAVYKTPAGVLCPIDDPEAQVTKVQEGVDYNGMIKRANVKGRSAEDVKWELELKSQIEEKRQKEREAKLSATQSPEALRLAKEARQRAEVATIVRPVEAALATVQEIAQVAPGPAAAITPLILPILHQLIRGAVLGGPEAVCKRPLGTRATVASDPGSDDDTALFRERSQEVVRLIAHALDLTISHSHAIVDILGRGVASFFEVDSTTQFAIVSDVAKLKGYYVASKTPDLVAIAAALTEVGEFTEVSDAPFSPSSFSFLMPLLDAFIRMGPTQSSDEVEVAEEADTDTMADAETKEADEDFLDDDDEVSLGLGGFNGFAARVRDTVYNGVRMSAVLLAAHGAAAAASNASQPRLDGADDALDDSKFPIIPMLSLTLAGLNRLPPTFSKERDLLANALQRLASTLKVGQLGYLIGEFGLFSPNPETAIASLRALERCHVLVARDALFQSGAIREDDRSLFADVGVRVWTLAHDANSDVASMAKAIIKALNLDPTAGDGSGAGIISVQDMLTKLRNFTANRAESIRVASAQAIYTLLGRLSNPDETRKQFEELNAIFDANYDYTIPARTLRESPTFVSRFEHRHGVALTYGACVPLIEKQPSILEPFLDFVLYRGVSDLDNEVWNAALNAGLKLIHLFGDKLFDQLERKFQTAIKSGKPVPVKEASQGERNKAAAHMREGAFILYGNTGQMTTNLEATSRLIEALIGAVLETTTISAQDSAAACLVPLVERLAKASASAVSAALTGAPAAGVKASEAKGADKGEKEAALGSAAVAEVPLPTPSEMHPTLNRMLKTLSEEVSRSPKIRQRAAAVCFASVVAGIGGRALRLYNVLAFLEARFKVRTESVKLGAILTLGALARVIGKTFAPYAPVLLKLLMPLLGESSSEIRSSAKEAIATIMRVVDGASAQLILPLLLESAKASAWRTRVEAIQIIATMTKLASHVQGQILPTIAPVLFEALIDIAPEVRAAAKEAMTVVLNAIRSPEVRRVRDLIAKALSDPNSGAPGLALSELGCSTFKHQIDPISVALLMPTLRWGLRSREIKCRKVALQLLGSLTQIVPSMQDIAPYRKQVLRYVKGLLMDPSPEIRRISSRALSAIFRSEGGVSVQPARVAANVETAETVLEQLLGVLDQAEVVIPNVTEHQVLASRGTTEVQRSGAALGAAELLTLRAEEGMQLFLSRFSSRITSPNADIREGYLFLAYEMAISFGKQYGDILETVFPFVLDSLSDSAQRCREAAVRLGQHIAIHFSRSHKDHLLAPLVGALVSPDWRTRQGSAMLMASLLLRTAGLSGYITIAEAEDDIAQHSTQAVYQARKQHTAISSEAQEQLIEESLTPEVRNEVYTSLYIMQTDGVSSVATVASRLWVALVPSENRMMNRILPTLVDRVVSDLASTEPIRQHTAGSSLNRLVSRYQDRVLQVVAPILLDAFASHDPSRRRGVCFGIGEILGSATRNTLENYLPDFLSTIRESLCDINPEVREAARSACAALYNLQGIKIVKDLVFPMIQYLERSHVRYLEKIKQMRETGIAEEVIEAERDVALNVLEGFKELYKLPYLESATIEMTLKHFIKPPLTPFHIQCLSILTSSDAAFDKFVPTITEELLSSVRVLFEYKEGEDEDFEEPESDEKQDESSESKDEGASMTKKLTPEEEARLQERRLRAKEAATLIQSAEQVMRGLGKVGLTAIVNVLVGRLGVDEAMITSFQNKVGTRVAACKLIGAAISSTAQQRAADEVGADGYLNEDRDASDKGPKDYIAPAFRALISCLMDDYPSVQAAASDAIRLLVESTSPEILLKHVALIRNRFNEITGRDHKTGHRKIKEVPGLAAGCLASLLNYYQNGLVNSMHTSIRDQSAVALAELVSLAPAAALRPHVVKLTGPLIRSFGDRYSPEVRAQILVTLGVIFSKNGTALRAFQPQLQATFWKGLLDPHTSIRNAAVVALPDVLAESRRVDTVLEDMVKTIEENADISICSSVAKCLRLTMARRDVISKLSEGTLTSIVEVINRLLQSEIDAQRIEGARLVGILVRDVSEEMAGRIAANIVLLGGLGGGAVSLPPWQVRQAVSMAFSCILMDTPERFMKLVGKKTAVRALSFGFRDENEGSCAAAVRLAGRLLLAANNEDDQKLVQLLCQELLVLAATSAVDAVKLTAVEQVCKFAEQDPDAAEHYKSVLIPHAVRARSGANKQIRKAIDVILFYALNFYESPKQGMINAEAFASNFSTGDAAEFIGLCKRSVIDIRPSKQLLEGQERPLSSAEAPNPEED